MQRVHKPFRRVISVNVAWTWNKSYQEIYEKIKSLVKEDPCMKYYNARKLLDLETYASVVVLGTALLQLRDNLSCGYD